MKILHTVQLYEPHKGGSEEVVRQLSERLAAKGHDVTVATGKDPRRTFSVLNGVRVEEFDVRGNLVSGIEGDVDGYRRFVKQFRGDVILNYAAQIWTTDLCFDMLDDIQAAKVLVPCGYLLGDPVFEDYYRGLPKQLRKYDGLIYMSRSYQDFRFGQEVGVGDKAVVIPNGAAEEEFEPPSPSFKEAFDITTPVMVLAVANHYHLKGHKRIIEAFLSTERRDATLVIIGEKEGRPWRGCYYSCKINSLFRSKIRVLEGVPREMVVAAYKEADVLVLGSEIECAPLVIYEAMAAGTPFVSTSCGNVKDHQEAGIVVDDPDDLGKALSSLLSGPDIRKEYGERGRHLWRSDHTWSSIVDRYEKLYLDLVAKR